MIYESWSITSWYIIQCVCVCIVNVKWQLLIIILFWYIIIAVW